MKFRLSLMMFLQFFIWGAWFEIGFSYFTNSKMLGFSELQQNLMFWAFNIGALVALFFSTQFADRNFAAEKFLAFSHLVGGLAILGIYFLHPAPGQMGDFTLFLALMVVHSIFYVPTISITNSIAFANLKDPSQDFGPVRVWGTIGWIAASWPFIFLQVDWDQVAPLSELGFVKWLGTALGTPKSGEAVFAGQSYAFLVAGIASLVLSLFSLTLPHTPPKPAAAGESPLAWLKAMKLLAHPFVLVLFLVTFVDAAIHQSYFFWIFDYLGDVVKIPSNWIGPVTKIGQIAEILTMLVLGYVLKTLGWRWTMTIGVLGHAARFAVFAFFPEPWAAVSINLLHGICYAFFFATVYIFVDEYFPKDVRSSAQGLFNVLILGIGPVVATFICIKLKAMYSVDVPDPTDASKMTKVLNYPAVFQYSMYAGVAAASFLFLFFHPPKKQEKQAPEPRV